MTRPTAPDCDVVVIGAGAAGLAATARLLAQGLAVTCIEAADRIGGRAHTDTALFGQPFDMGARWLHNGPTNPFLDIGRALGFDMYPMPYHGFTQGDDPEGIALWAEVDRFTSRLRRAAEAGQDIAADTLFEDTNEWSKTAALMTALLMGRDLCEVSTTDWGIGSVEENWFCRQGYGALLARHAANVPVRLQTPARSVTRTPDGVSVGTDGGTLTARAAIVTVSLGVLAAGDIRFDPPLDNDRLGALDAITMGTYNHTALQFTPGTIPVRDDAWVTYRIETIRDGAFQGGAFHCNIGGSGLCSFENAGAFARDLETAGQDAAIAFALDRLADIFGSGIRKGFLKGHASDWGANPWTRGAYAGALPGQAHRRDALRQPHAERILFAGEATHPTEPGTVAGAHKEGLRAAAEVTRDLAELSERSVLPVRAP